MTLLLDTDVCIALLRGLPATMNRLASLSPDDCGISVVTAFELFAGAAKARAPEKERAKIDRLLKVVGVLAFDQVAAESAARVRAELEQAGTPIGSYDLLIAGHAIALELTLATGNLREFKRVRGLPLDAWL